jgi:hypothetical protein
MWMSMFRRAVGTEGHEIFIAGIEAIADFHPVF